MRIALVDSPRLTYWRDAGHRLRGLIRFFGPEDEAILVSPADGDALPVLAGWGRESDVSPLIDASRVLSAVKRLQPDLCIAPLGGGLAHGILMARACGEVPSNMRVALIAEEPSRSIALRGDLTPACLRPLVADAMERFCLEQADALLTSDGEDLGALERLGWAGLSLAAGGADIAPECRVLLRAGDAPPELCFIGAFTRAANVVTFIEAAERIFADDSQRFARVAFVGPMPEVALAAGREWLGRRAAGWRFPFKTVETESFEEALAYAIDVKALAYVPHLPMPFGEIVVKRGFVQCALPCAAEIDSAHLESAILGMPAEMPAQSEGEFAAAIARLSSIAPRAAASEPVGLSVCILHKDRPAFLQAAIESVRRQIATEDRHRIELIVYDNGSTGLDSIRTLADLAIDSSLRVFQEPGVPNPRAMNAMAACATKDFVAFLDDDNLMAEGGLAALLRACARDVFDVIVSNLSVVDADQMAAVPVAKLAFIGPARTAGLFFNGFGDTSMVFRRSAFERIGGFLDANAPMPGADWLLLARAQAAGLRIGVLQEPAFLYRRDVARADRSWQKYDQHHVRSLVLQHYGDGYDAALVAKLAQALAVELI